MAISATQFTLLCVIGIILLARPAHAFGAGNIGSTSKIEGENWRHGDLEDTFLTLVASRAMGGKKFSKLDVKRIYFGNWLRDYSQAVDVGTVKNVSAEAIRLILWVLGFMSFGYGTKEFEVTSERLGCYRPEEHIDNPKDYADNQDARDYDRRLRGPVDEHRELAIDPELGLKAYIASENLGIDTSAGLVRKLFGRSVELGRRYARNNDKNDLYEALRLLGTGCHCLEDFSAHSNFTELVLIELGERNVFPHVGRNTKVRLRGARSEVYPLITGTFGGVDFLHSVTGEFDDKVTQSEIQELEGTLQQAQQQGQNTSVIQDLLQKLPEGIFGGKDEAGKADELKTNSAQAAMANTQISPREPEEWLQYIKDVQKQLYPILEWHDEIMQSITETIDKIPVLPDMIEKIQEEVNIFVFSLMAPFMLPIISQIKTELNTGSSAIIQSSLEKQHIVFSDDECSDPTHSMLSKDHFSNVLNEPAGKVAGQVLRWVVPQLISAWDDESIDVDRTLNRIIRGVFHHPALRQMGEDGAADGRHLMFGVVEQWWQNKSEREKDGLRDQLSRSGVEQGRNHKPGVHDHGHGSAKKLGMPNANTAGHQGAPGGYGGPSGLSPYDAQISQLGQSVSEAVGGGVLGGIAGGLASAVGRGAAAGAMGDQSEQQQSYDNRPQTYGRQQQGYGRTGYGDESNQPQNYGRTSYGNQSEQTQSYGRTSYGDDGSRTHTVTHTSGDRNTGNYGQSQYSRTDDPFGGRTEQHSSYEQRHAGGSHGGTYTETTRFESSTSSSGFGRHDDSSGGFGSSGFSSGRNTYGQQESIGGGFDSEQTSSFNRRRDDDNERSSYGRRDDDDNQRSSYGRRHDDDDNDNRRSHGRKDSNDSDEEKKSRKSHGRNSGNDSDDDKRKFHGRRGSNDSDKEKSSYGRRNQQSEYGSGSGGYGQQSSYGRNERSDEYGSGGHGQTSSYGETSSYGQTSGYGQDTSSYGRTAGDNYGEHNYGSSGFGASSGFDRTNQAEEYGSSGFGSSRRRDEDASENMPGGFGGGDDDSQSYGRQRNDNDSSEGYGSRRYGGGGGYGY